MQKLSNKIYRFYKKSLRPKTEWLLTQVVALFWIVLAVGGIAAFDFLDTGSLVGYGWFNKNEADVFLNFISGLLLFLTFIIAFKTSTESQKQTELLTRPYLRVTWVNEPLKGDRSEQGVVHSCISLVNDGEGIMKKVQYKIRVGNDIAQIRNHAIIAPRGSVTAVAYLPDATKHIIGVRQKDMDKETFLKNGDLIKRAYTQGGISIEGYYKDLTEHTYPFRFILDPAEQSWFVEDWIQKRED